jgi:alkanesulfonate monooxygenase SsuD/methylene tetrahydromethanopterin reductase-like flavin-dependent oxidoreductase (luciferase family)
MTKLGYTLSSEEFDAPSLVAQAERAEQAGFSFASISDLKEAAEALDEEDIAESVVCGPDPERHRAAIQEYVDAGYDHVYVHQVGPDQDGFFDFYEREVLPAFT